MGGDPSDGAVSRRQIAQVLFAGLTSPAAVRQTFELAAEPGPAQADLEPLFAALQPDAAGSVDAVLDVDNLPLDGEPASVCQQLLDVPTGGENEWGDPCQLW